jgi:hypothetical protein
MKRILVLLSDKSTQNRDKLVSCLWTGPGLEVCGLVQSNPLDLTGLSPTLDRDCRTVEIIVTIYSREG